MPQGGYRLRLQDALEKAQEEEKEEGGDALEKDQSRPGAPAKVK